MLAPRQSEKDLQGPHKEAPNAGARLGMQVWGEAVPRLCPEPGVWQDREDFVMAGGGA